MEFALGGCPLAEEADGDAILAAHLVGQRQAHRQRQAAADDGIAAVEIVLAAEQVHGAAAASRAAFGLAVHLGHHLAHGDAAHQRVGVLAVGCHQPVVCPQCADHAGGDRLLAVIEMQEAADLSRTVEFGTFRLKPADTDHAAQKVQHMVA